MGIGGQDTEGIWGRTTNTKSILKRYMENGNLPLKKLLKALCIGR